MRYNDNMIFNTKTNKWYKNGKGSGWILKESCKNCGEKYFTRYDSPSDFCSRSCKSVGKNNPMFGKTHTKEIREKLRLY